MSINIQEAAKRQLEICNSCRYCEGFCAVFPAIQRRRDFGKQDVDFLANLCHGCKGCFYSCQYAPPHPFEVNLPRTLAQARNETYAEYAWPRGAGRLFQRNGLIVALFSALVTSLVLLVVAWLRDRDSLLGVHRGEGAFYNVIPWDVMAGISGATFIYALLALAMGVRNFWRATTPDTRNVLAMKPATQAAGDILTLRNLGKDGGCNDIDASYSNVKRRLHHAMFYGFMLCFLATCLGTIYDHFLGIQAPYPLLHPVVITGTVGGVLLTGGTVGLLGLKFVADQEPTAKELLGADTALLALLALIAITGLALLGLRETAAMGILLALHLGPVWALFIIMPYSKFAHAGYRAAALLRDRHERALLSAT